MHTVGELEEAAREFVTKQTEPNEFGGCYSFITLESVPGLLVEAWQRTESNERARDSSYVVEKIGFFLVDAAEYAGRQTSFPEVILLTQAIERIRHERTRRNELVAAQEVRY